ncbi:PP2C family protein-serine/threonine phosphatase [Actinomycetospora straminea]|uniref:PPM-type phosphatase domain-containing protein n=1 Tax=Actinomycetospora straminea TaxID=663607 RepID=A0ABP9F0E3_9PSEU|nr:GAF domain-containing SpoIIE family protein phosphatase [Actinomycetospora straminea]MDD7935747.1 SpoIIE family protein phosphatase [Actinomycetospora straminea]
MATIRDSGLATSAGQSRARVFDADADDAFDRLARLATSLTGVALGAVWLVLDGRAYLRSASGAGASAPSARDARQQGTPVDRSLCSVVLGEDTAAWVEEAGDEPHTRGWVETTFTDVRAFAGVPIRDPGGTAIGVLCAVDADRHPWSAQDRDVLTTLAQAATGEVALRSALADSRAEGSAAARRAAASDHAAAEAGRQAREAGVQAREAGAAVVYYREQARSAGAQAATSDQLAADAQRLAKLAEDHAAEADEFAATLRESLLPARLPDFPGVEVAARYRPGTGASVLGDFYDLFPTPGGWGAVVGDVCGKGPQAARTTALARSTVRAIGHTDDDPASVLAALHGVLHVWFDQRPSFVTAVYAGMAPRTDAEGLAVGVASAGHPPAVLQRRDGTVVALEAGGRALGIREEPRVALERVDLDVGDRLILVTDGVTEARPTGGGELELAGLLAVVEGLDPAGRADLTADAVLAAVDDHAAGAALDDTALLVIRAGRRPGG